MNKIKLFIALLIGLIASATTMAQTVNMSSYITLTVTKDAAIRLNLKAAATNTPIRIVSGSNTQDITVGTAWTGKRVYNADGTNMTIYGDLTGFDCSVNVAKLTALDASKNTQLTVLFCSNNQLTALDVSKNTQLAVLDCSNNQLTALDVSKNTPLATLFCSKNQLTTLDISKNTQLTTLFCSNNQLTSLDVSKNMQLAELDCYDNNFSTAALDAIYCALPVREAADNAKIHPVYDASSANHATALATNKQNAIDKNWKVQYYADNTDIPTTGSYVCPATGISEATNEKQLILYPNPVCEELYLSTTAHSIHIYLTLYTFIICTALKYCEQPILTVSPSRTSPQEYTR